jgi:thiol-disulfide isomerase/thioredoxin
MEGNMVSVQIAALAVVLSASGETALLDFHAPWCAPCRSMQSTIAGLERAGYPVRKVNVDQDRPLARQFNVNSVPCFVLVVDGREAGRLTGVVRRAELEGLFARAGVRRDTAGLATTRAQSPDPPRPDLAQRGASEDNPPARSRFERGGSTTHAAAATSRGASVAAEDLIHSSVHLTIGDPQGFSHGTGTLIDARRGEALVLTCGHIFRDSQGKGEIMIDFCSPGGPKQVPGHLVNYDLESDVALVSVRPGVRVRFAPLAPKGYPIAKGDRVITVGCNNGGPATAEESTITAVNKFRAPPNLSVAGLPVQGRSGGGLFTADGQVIGVCNAADPTDHEGLYAALAAIHAELDKIGLTAIYENPPPLEADATATVGTRGHMPGAADASFADRGARIVPASMGAGDGAQGAAVAETVESADGAEVICIIRSLSNPDAKSEVIMLDRASTDFLRQLAADRKSQEARHLTSLKVRSKSGSARPESR